MKGVEKGTGLRMSEVIAQGLPIDQERIAVASGPNLALEIAREQPTAAVVSSVSLETAQAVAMAATNRYFRSFVNTDVIGTEFGGVLKNLIAVAIGIVDGVGYGENTKASIITRGLVEMTDFAVAYGAQAETLAGAGRARRPDRDVRVVALPQQHRRAPARPGLQLQRRREADEPDRGGTRVGGADPRLAAARGVEMPIVRQVSQVLAGTLEPRDIAPHLTTDGRTRRAKGPRMTDKTAVALLFGGRSSEHSISCATAAGVLGAIDREPLRRHPGRHHPRRRVHAAAGRRGVVFALNPRRCRRCDDNGTRIALARVARDARADGDGRRRHAARRSATSTSCSRSCTARGARTAPSRACSSSSACRMSAAACSRRALGMDKHFTKTVLQQAGIPVAPWETVTGVRVGAASPTPSGRSVPSSASRCS